MGNTYTIEGLKVPEVDAAIATIKEELSSLRTLFGSAVEAITRLDADITMLADAMPNVERFPDADASPPPL